MDARKIRTPDGNKTRVGPLLLALVILAFPQGIEAFGL